MPAGQALQELEMMPPALHVPAAQGVATPPAHELPGGQGVTMVVPDAHRYPGDVHVGREGTEARPRKSVFVGGVMAAFAFAQQQAPANGLAQHVPVAFTNGPVFVVGHR